MKIIIIAAKGKNNELGKDNKLLWNLPNDLKFFFKKTNGKTIVMGRKTFESLPKMLPNRKHIVITRGNQNFPDNVLVFNNILDTLKYIKTLDEDVYIIGGGQVYQEFLPFSDMMYLTEVNATVDADTYFPFFDENNWEKQIIDEGNENQLEYKHMQYVKKV